MNDWSAGLNLWAILYYDSLTHFLFTMWKTNGQCVCMSLSFQLESRSDSSTHCLGIYFRLDDAMVRHLRHFTSGCSTILGCDDSFKCQNVRTMVHCVTHLLSTSLPASSIGVNPGWGLGGRDPTDFEQGESWWGHRGVVHGSWNIIRGECSKMPRVSKMPTPLKRIASCRFVV